MILNECRLMKVNGLSKLLFVAVPSGTGKTYCINALLNVFRRNYNIAIAVASSGTAALLLKDGTVEQPIIHLKCSWIFLPP